VVEIDSGQVESVLQGWIANRMPNVDFDPESDGERPSLRRTFKVRRSSISNRSKIPREPAAGELPLTVL
jgi:hypothetical protein